MKKMMAMIAALIGIAYGSVSFADENNSRWLQISDRGPESSYGTFIYDPKQLKWAAYAADGTLVASGKGSGGNNYCSDVKRGCRTPVGQFAVYHKGPVECRSTKFPIGKGGAYMPHCMFFKGGYAIHGATNLPEYNASHGCVRVHPTAAKWLYENFVRPGTKVVILPYNA